MSADESVRLERWNRDRLRRLKFDEAQQATLLAWGTSPHDVEKLLNRGCSHDLALRILQPDDDFVVLDVAERVAEYSVRV